MDSRPQDDFNQPESVMIDDDARVTDEMVSNEPPASGMPGEDDDGSLLGLSDDFEAELASLLAPDLDAIDLGDLGDLDGLVAEARPAGTPDGEQPDDAATIIETTVAVATVQATGEAIALSAPEAGSDDVAASAPETVEATVSIEAISVTTTTAVVVVEETAPMAAGLPDVEVAEIDVAAPALAAPSPSTPADQPLLETLPAAAAPVEASIAAPAEFDVPAVTDASVVAAVEAIAEAAAMTAEAMDETRAAGPEAPLEAMSFEAALEAQDIQEKGFEAAVRGAADRAEARFLFQMPVHTVPDCKRVAAVNLPGTEKPVTVLVLLQEDGRSVRMEDARASDNPFAGMAVSYGGLLAHLKSLPTRSAA
ncbi:hypothetical protein EJC49_25175 [Aquibium carbonis]|uniref:Uncharacterized protein n=1 Tax=Aquibium carbonis TaxID=2495581 RepID=A0A3R9ZVN1_9HYPH|nr:hypothetical protein [Aquibium carbonis]RST79237.1 hypothetical protein EJC49_25175 [Aquibium carbonis]